jgi:phosphatidylglycerophosphate synthase
MTGRVADRAPGRPGPTAADFLARHRGGGLFTETVSQRLGALICVPAYRLGLAPTALTLGNLLLGLVASVGVVALAPALRHGRASAPLVGLAALVLWHLAYALDCADGQLARVTGKASPAGKRVDILADAALQIALVAAVATVARAHTPGLPVWLATSFAGTWMVNLVTSGLQQGDSAASLVTSSSPVVRVVKLVRDYGAVVTVIGLVLAFAPGWTAGLMIFFVAVNGLFLLASVAAAARESLRTAGS